MSYRSNPPFLIFDIRALWRSVLNVRAPDARMSKINNGGLDQYGAEPFEQQQFGTAGVEGVNDSSTLIVCSNVPCYYEKLYRYTRKCGNYSDV